MGNFFSSFPSAPNEVQQQEQVPRLDTFDNDDVIESTEYYIRFISSKRDDGSRYIESSNPHMFGCTMSQSHSGSQLSDPDKIECIQTNFCHSNPSLLAFWSISYKGGTAMPIFSETPSAKAIFNGLDSDNILLQLTHNTRNGHRSLFAYELQYTVIDGRNKGKVLCLQWQILTVTSRSGRKWLFSPDSSYLLCFGPGCSFLPLPNIKQFIQTKIDNNNDITVKQLTNVVKKHEWRFTMFEHINQAHFVTDTAMICTDGYYSKPIQPSDVEMKSDKRDNISTPDIGNVVINRRDPNQLFLLNLEQYCLEPLDIIGKPQQFVTSGHSYIVFSCDKWTQYQPEFNTIKAPNDRKDSLWVYDMTLPSKKNKSKLGRLIGYNDNLERKIKGNWDNVNQNEEFFHMIKRNSKGNKYWLIAMNPHMDGVWVFDLPSAILSWKIDRGNFTMGRPNLSLGAAFLCDIGVVRVGTIEGTNNFQLQPVQFYDSDEIHNLLLPFFGHISPLIDITIGYIGEHDVSEPSVSLFEKFPRTGIYVSDGYSSVVMIGTIPEQSKTVVLYSTWREMTDFDKKSWNHMCQIAHD